MPDDIEVSSSGVLFRWQILAKWGWKILEVITILALTGHIWMTAHKQTEQNERINELNKAIEKCLEKHEPSRPVETR